MLFVLRVSYHARHEFSQPIQYYLVINKSKPCIAIYSLHAVFCGVWPWSAVFALNSKHKFYDGSKNELLHFVNSAIAQLAYEGIIPFTALLLLF